MDYGLRESIHFGLGIEAFIAPNNDGSGRSDWHVSDGHGNCWGPFRRMRDARSKGNELFQAALGNAEQS
jgi:hypothetical protein